MREHTDIQIERQARPKHEDTIINMIERRIKEQDREISREDDRASSMTDDRLLSNISDYKINISQSPR